LRKDKNIENLINNTSKSVDNTPGSNDVKVDRSAKGILSRIKNKIKEYKEEKYKSKMLENSNITAESTKGSYKFSKKIMDSLKVFSTFVLPILKKIGSFFVGSKFFSVITSAILAARTKLRGLNLGKDGFMKTKVGSKLFGSTVGKTVNTTVVNGATNSAMRNNMGQLLLPPPVNTGTQLVTKTTGKSLVTNVGVKAAPLLKAVPGAASLALMGHDYYKAKKDGVKGSKLVGRTLVGKTGDTITGMLGNGLKQAAKYAGIGFTIGTIFPVVGNLIGAAAGGIIGLISGIFGSDPSKAMNNLGKGMKSAGKAFGNIISGITKGIVKLPIILLKNVFKGIKLIAVDIPNVVFKIVKGISVLIFNLVKSVIWDLPKMIAKGFLKFTDYITSLPQKISDWFGGLGERITKGIENFFKVDKDGKSGIGKLFTGIGKGIISLIKGIFWHLPNFILFELPKALVGIVTGIVKIIGSTIKGIFWDIPKAIVKGIYNSIVSEDSLLNNILMGIVKGIVWPIKKIFWDIPKFIIKAIKGVFFDLPKMVISGIGKLLKGIFWDLPKALMDKVVGYVNKFKGFLSKLNPLKWFKKKDKTLSEDGKKEKKKVETKITRPVIVDKGPDMEFRKITDKVLKPTNNKGSRNFRADNKLEPVKTTQAITKMNNKTDVFNNDIIKVADVFFKKNDNKINKIKDDKEQKLKQQTKQVEVLKEKANSLNLLKTMTSGNSIGLTKIIEILNDIKGYNRKLAEEGLEVNTQTISSDKREISSIGKILNDSNSKLIEALYEIFKNNKDPKQVIKASGLNLNLFNGGSLEDSNKSTKGTSRIKKSTFKIAEGS